VHDHGCSERSEEARGVQEAGGLMVWLPQELTSVREFQSADGLSRGVIFRRLDGLFGFCGERQVDVDGMTVWHPWGEGGIYETVDAAERAAMAEMPWIFDRNSN